MTQQPHFWDYIAKGNEHTTWKRRVFIAPLFTITTTWKQPKCPSVDEWIKQMWYIYNGILLGHKKEEVLPFVTIRMNLEDIALSEISQKEIDKYCTISFLCGLKKKKTYRKKDPIYSY